MLEYFPEIEKYVDAEWIRRVWQGEKGNHKKYSKSQARLWHSQGKGKFLIREIIEAHIVNIHTAEELRQPFEKLVIQIAEKYIGPFPRPPRPKKKKP